MDASPTVSVVMPVYNGARYLAETLDSILAQTYRDFELLVMDDGSTDQTPEILRKYAGLDSRLNVLSRPNRGIVKSRNELLKLCRGRYMACNDADDLSVPTRFEKQVEYMESHPECVLLGSRLIVTDPFGSPLHESLQKLTHEEIERELLGNGGGWALVQSSIMCRTDAARRIGGYRGAHPVFSEDHDFYVRLAHIGRVANLAEPLVWYRRHQASTTGTYYLKKTREHAVTRERVLREAHAQRGLPFPEDWKFEPIKPVPPDQQARLWGWAALRHGNVTIARHHACEALRLSPLSWESWKLLLVAHRESPQTPGQKFPEFRRPL